MDAWPHSSPWPAAMCRDVTDSHNISRDQADGYGCRGTNDRAVTYLDGSLPIRSNDIDVGDVTDQGIGL
jgi:hypothetical protein